MAICEYNPDECVVTVGKDGRHYHSASHIPLRDEYCPIYMPTRIVPFPRGGPEVRHWKDAPPPPPSDPANQMDVGGPRDRFGDWALIIIPLLAWLGLVCFLLCAGCHGTELRLGTGRTFNDFSASGGSYDDDDDRNSSNSSSFSFDQGDSTSAWIELGFQLTPQTVVLDQGSFLPPAIPATAPASTTPVAFPVIDLAHLQASIEDLVAL